MIFVISLIKCKISNMETITFKVSKKLKEKFKKKAGLISLSAILRILVEKYIRGEIDIEKN